MNIPVSPNTRGALVDPHIQKSEGSHLMLRLMDGEFLCLQIIKPFLPCTKSQVVLVRPESARRAVPQELVHKIFDPRYLNDRIPSTPGYPPHLWTLEAEIEAARYRQEIAEGKRPDSNGLLNKPDHEDEAYFWEDYFYKVMKESWECETLAFSRLTSVQGTAIPKLYG
ncbi:hypothetical protein M413DRAFT_31721 [Hebeloma cylindrosporum]|uniref:Uncharacterized protein n=1 Tax=Hebeloma cylindrosporum TaxID=76867 RepID=A0A0C2XEF8_HEBCY|nr:hypothetical protein M413DRAFT_31721 [Hebeloma cylindrosporum h7]